MSKGEAQKAVPVTSHALIRLLCDLGVSSEGSFEPYHPRVRDRGDVRALRCSLSGVIVLDRVDHIDISHYDARDEHSTTILLPGAEKAIEVTLPPLRPNDDDRLQVADGEGRSGHLVAPLHNPLARIIGVIAHTASPRLREQAAVRLRSSSSFPPALHPLSKKAPAR